MVNDLLLGAVGIGVLAPMAFFAFVVLLAVGTGFLYEASGRIDQARLMITLFVASFLAFAIRSKLAQL